MRHLVLSLIIILGVSSSTLGATVFTEDFDGLVTGSLAGQNGWTGDAGIHVVSGGVGFPGSNALDGLTNPAGSGAVQIVQTGFAPLDPGGATTLTFEAFAASSGTTSHSSGLGFHDGSGLQHSWMASGFTPSESWLFLGPGVNHAVAGGFDQIVALSVVLDPLAGEFYGVYDFGSGPQETPHFALSATEFADTQGVMIVQDFRQFPSLYRSADFDSISVTTVPEPGTGLVCLLLGALGFVRRKAQSV